MCRLLQRAGRRQATAHRHRCHPHPVLSALQRRRPRRQRQRQRQRQAVPTLVVHLLPLVLGILGRRCQGLPCECDPAVRQELGPLLWKREGMAVGGTVIHQKYDNGCVRAHMNSSRKQASTWHAAAAAWAGHKQQTEAAGPYNTYCFTVQHICHNSTGVFQTFATQAAISTGQ